MNEALERGGDLPSIGYQDSKFILEQIGGPISGEAQVLADIRELDAAAQQAERTAARMADEARQVQDDIEERRHENRLADIAAKGQRTDRRIPRHYRSWSTWRTRSTI